MKKCFGGQRLRRGVKIRSTILILPLLMLLLILMTGCVTAKLDTSRGLIETHPKGFKDAVNASPEARLFVKDALGVIVNLEHIIESGD